MRRAFFGGTFDPVHRGHLDVAAAARRALGLDRLSFVPARVPPHRAVPRASAAHRFAMVALALQGQAGLTVSDIEMLAGGPSYTSATLDRLAASGIDTRTCVLVVGADAFLDIESWKAYPAFLDRCSFAVVSRPNQPVAGLRAAVPALASRMIDAGSEANARPHLAGNPAVFLVDAPTAPVSSTDIRRRVAEGASIHEFVPAAVAEYIHKHGLYLEETPTPAA